jgi:hypothetical protein
MRRISPAAKRYTNSKTSAGIAPRSPSPTDDGG